MFLNSHLLSEIEVTCDRVAFIKHGEVIRVSELKTLSETQASVTIRAQNVSEAALAGLSQWGRDVRRDGATITLAVASDALLPEMVRYLVAQGADVYAVTPQRLSLEDLFIQTVGTEGVL